VAQGHQGSPKDPESARKHLLKNTLTPDDVIGDVPMLGYFTVAELTDANKKEFQKFIDFSMKLINAPEKVDVEKYMKAY
jgi:NitT/TauT family transport system substrate-binding protein